MEMYVKMSSLENYFLFSYFSCGFSWETRTHNGRNAISTSATVQATIDSPLGQVHSVVSCA